MPEHPFGWFSLSPPVIAIVLAIATRRIVFSLVAGIFAGALLTSRGDFLTAVHHTWEIHLWNTLVDPDKLRVFSFTLLMGAMIGVVTRSGGMQGLIRLVSPLANSRRRGQLVTWFLGLLIFFDDYANTILLGNTLRPVCDRLKISREKLAYLVDSTAAPVAGLALVSTWVAVEIDYISSGLDAIGDNKLSAFSLFVDSIPYRFYIWSALFLVPIIATIGRDFGPMLRAEQEASQNTSAELQASVQTDDGPVSAWYHALVPIAITLGLVVFCLYQTGSLSVCDDRAAELIAQVEAIRVDQNLQSAELNRLVDELGKASARGDVGGTNEAIVALNTELGAQSSLTAPLSEPILLRDVVGAADSSLALQYGALAGLLVAVLLPWGQRLVPLDQLGKAASDGARVVLPALAILWSASAMSRMTTGTAYDYREPDRPYAFQDHRLYTADFLTQILSGEGQGAGSGPAFPVFLLPTVVFVLAGAVAFCTGTSWGTMGILMPMVIQTSHAVLGGTSVPADHPIFLCSIAGVLSGAVFGDHCSPISDTTVLSSQSSGCNHLKHVWTQMPYAMAAAAISILMGTVPVALGVPVWPLLGIQLAALIALVCIIGKDATSGVANGDSSSD